MYKIKYLDGTYKEFENLRGAYLKGADLRKADLRGASLIEADLIEADLEGADLYEADLRGASLIEADLIEADLRGADLRGANLIGACLDGAYLENTCIYSFSIGKHFGFYHEGYVKIGCIGMTLEEWLNEVESIGEKNDYSKKEIERYKLILNVFKEMH